MATPLGPPLTGWSPVIILIRMTTSALFNLYFHINSLATPRKPYLTVGLKYSFFSKMTTRGVKFLSRFSIDYTREGTL